MNQEAADVQVGGPWMTLASHRRSRPATIHAGLSYFGEGYRSHSWDADSAFALQQTPSEGVVSRPISMHQDLYPPGTPLHHHLDGGGWPKAVETYPFPPLQDMAVPHANMTEDAIPVLDLQYYYQHGAQDRLGNLMDPRRLSGSSYTVSTGAQSDLHAYDDLSTSMSDMAYSTADYPPTSNRNSLMSSTPLSPLVSPRLPPQGRPDLVRTSSRGHGSPSPRSSGRSAPYSLEPRNKRWSTGSYGTANRRPPPFASRSEEYHQPEEYQGYPLEEYRSSVPMPSQLPSQLPSHVPSHISSQIPPQLPPHFAQVHQLPSHLHQFHHPQLPTQPYPDRPYAAAPAPLLIQGAFRMLQSNGDPHALHGCFVDHSDPPDLYAALQEDQTQPPPEDMNPSDPDLVPHEQELRFDGDLYTPRWVRGHGNKREGWCGVCKPGRWLVLKNSAFWYDKSFSHGISAATGGPFQEPQEMRRMDGNPEVWEGLCGGCHDWVALVSSKKKGTTWFRHAYKCHTHPKTKDAPKRRHENSHSRAAPGAAPGAAPAAAQTSGSWDERQPAAPPPRTTTSPSTTPTPAQMGMQYARPPLPNIPRSKPKNETRAFDL